MRKPSSSAGALSNHYDIQVLRDRMARLTRASEWAATVAGVFVAFFVGAAISFLCLIALPMTPLAGLVFFLAPVVLGSTFSAGARRLLDMLRNPSLLGVAGGLSAVATAFVGHQWLGLALCIPKGGAHFEGLYSALFAVALLPVLVLAVHTTGALLLRLAARLLERRLPAP